MFLRDFGAAARRRWILVLIGLVMSAGMAAAGWLITRPTYQITAAMLLLPPKSTVPSDGNPLLQLGGLDLTVDLLGQSLSDQAVTEQIKQISPNAEFEVGADPNSSGPILRIQVRDKSEAKAAEIRDLLVELAPTRLTDIQNGVGVTTRNRVTISVLVSDQVAEPVGRDKLQAAVIAGGGGLVLWAVVIALVDTALLRRAARRPVTDDSSPAPAGPEEASDAPAPEGREDGETDDPRDAYPGDRAEDSAAAPAPAPPNGADGETAAFSRGRPARRRDRRRWAGQDPLTAADGEPTDSQSPAAGELSGEEAGGVETRP